MTRRYWFPKGYADWAARLRVPCGFLVAGAFAWMARPTWGSLIAGLPPMLAGMALRAWAAGHLAKNERLATGGPYAYTRNPLYLGTLLVAAGLTLAARRPELGLLAGALFVLAYLPAIEQEEQHLRKLFAEYADYARRTPMLWPRLRRAPGVEHFSWDLYLRNREHQALLGLAAGLALLAFKAWR